MIDIHTHILPGIDDGPSEVSEALAMARAAAGDGLKQLVATPHSSWGAGDPARVQEQVTALQAALDAADIRLQVLAGAEVWLTPETTERYRTGQLCGINGGCYLLVELPPHQLPVFTEQVIFELQLAGVRPVLAHPERNSALEDSLEPLRKLVSRGVLSQITAGSLLGDFGQKAKETAELMITHRLAHVIASDAHDARSRLPVLSAAVKRAAQLIGPQGAEAMVTTTPAAIVAGRDFEALDPAPARRQWRPWGSST